MDDELKILEFWNKNKIFEKSLKKPAPRGGFVFYDGPPFATGLPHYGHLLQSFMKDAIPRYKTMRGYHVPRRWGWDCHGLPLENIIEKELKIKTKNDIEEIGIDKFNLAAKEAVLRYAGDWRRIIPRVGRWVDMDDDYKTMDWQYTESVWHVFKTLHDKGLVYEGYKSMHLCPRCGTTLSNFEVNQGYKDVTDTSVTVKFELANNPGTYLLAWTTTPWTLPGNVALAVNPKINYVLVEKGGKNYIAAKDLAIKIFGGDAQIVKEWRGKELAGKSYKPIFNYYGQKDFKIYSADFVTTEEGTGIVHIAPAFGEEDMELAKKEGLPMVQHIGEDGVIKKEVKNFAGLQAKAADAEIIKYLADKNVLFAEEKINHSYPHCWRCETPLLNYASSSWFVSVTAIKDKLISENKKIHWVPEHVRDGRFGKWLCGVRDWSVSRSRYWGAPLPVWKCGKCGEIKVVGSVADLGVKDKEPELHRPYIDEVTFKCKCGRTMRRVPEVFDCWFESGSMPYGQMHYPFENKDTFDPAKNIGYPADYIGEAVDQTRGWFYTMLVIGVALFGKASYKNVTATGLILAKDGQKMSKRLNNYPDPMHIVDTYGADSLRYYILASPVVRGENLNFSEQGVKEIKNKVVGRLKNVVSFYMLYASPVASGYTLSTKHVLDKWIVSRLNQLVADVTSGMESYEIDRAVRPIGDFVDDLSTWYIRRSRDRFKVGDVDALGTTRYALNTLARVIAPFMPFVAEEIWQVVGDEVQSVHLTEWPEGGDVDKKIIVEMAEVRHIVSLGLEARASAGIKVRQPLQKLKIKNSKISDELQKLILGEVNVKQIVFGDKFELDTELTDELKAEGNLRELIRAVQGLRKTSGLKPGEQAALIIQTGAVGKKFVEQFEEELKAATTMSQVRLGTAEGGEEIKIGNLKFSLKVDD